MKHYEFEISLFVEDELPENKKAELFAHLSKCKKCSSLLTDFSNIKSDLAQFYEALPQSKNELSHNLPDKKRINWSVRKPAFKISFSIAIVAVAIFFFLINSNLNQNKIHHHTLSPFETANSNKWDNYLFGDSIQHTMSNQNINDEEIENFNKVIDKALIARERNPFVDEILNIDADNGLRNFNEIINKSLVNYYRD